MMFMVCWCSESSAEELVEVPVTLANQTCTCLDGMEENLVGRPTCPL